MNEAPRPNGKTYKDTDNAHKYSNRNSTVPIMGDQETTDLISKYEALEDEKLKPVEREHDEVTIDLLSRLQDQKREITQKIVNDSRTVARVHGQGLSCHMVYSANRTQLFLSISYRIDRLKALRTNIINKQTELFRELGCESPNDVGDADDTISYVRYMLERPAVDIFELPGEFDQHRTPSAILGYLETALEKYPKNKILLRLHAKYSYIALCAQEATLLSEQLKKLKKEERSNPVYKKIESYCSPSCSDELFNLDIDILAYHHEAHRLKYEILLLKRQQVILELSNSSAVADESDHSKVPLYKEQTRQECLDKELLRLHIYKKISGLIEKRNQLLENAEDINKVIRDIHQSTQDFDEQTSQVRQDKLSSILESLKKAADSGNKIAQYRCGMLLRYSIFHQVEKNKFHMPYSYSSEYQPSMQQLKQAERYFSLAAKKGHRAAKQQLTIVSKEVVQLEQKQQRQLEQQKEERRRLQLQEEQRRWEQQQLLEQEAEQEEEQKYQLEQQQRQLERRLRQQAEQRHRLEAKHRLEQQQAQLGQEQLEHGVQINPDGIYPLVPRSSTPRRNTSTSPAIWQEMANLRSKPPSSSTHSSSSTSPSPEEEKQRTQKTLKLTELLKIKIINKNNEVTTAIDAICDAVGILSKVRGAHVIRVPKANQTNNSSRGSLFSSSSSAPGYTRYNINKTLHDFLVRDLRCLDNSGNIINNNVTTRDLNRLVNMLCSYQDNEVGSGNEELGFICEQWADAIRDRCIRLAQESNTLAMSLSSPQTTP